MFTICRGECPETRDHGVWLIFSTTHMRLTRPLIDPLFDLLADVAGAIGYKTFCDDWLCRRNKNGACDPTLGTYVKIHFSR